jgi:hypothetical protein
MEIERLRRVSMGVCGKLLLEVFPVYPQVTLLGVKKLTVENAQDKHGHGLRMPDQRRITAAIMREWAPHRDARALGAPYDRGKAKHQRHFTQTIPCISRTVIGQPGHSLLQDSMMMSSTAGPPSAKRSSGLHSRGSTH